MEKTKAITIREEENMDVHVNINNIKLEKSTQYKYLSVIIERNENIELGINERIQSALKLIYSANKIILNNNKIKKEQSETLGSCIHTHTNSWMG